MTMSASIPVTVTPEAAARIAELGFQAQVDQMIEYARTQLPEIVRIEVELYDRYELGDEPGLSVDAWSSRPFDPAEHISRDLSKWSVNTFPPEVLQHLTIGYHPGPDHAG
jgi:hypothetical protein